MESIQKQAFFAGQYQGLIVGEKYGKTGKSVKEAPHYDPEAKSKLSALFKEFISKPCAFIKKVSGFVDRPLEELKTAIPDEVPSKSGVATSTFTSTGL